jgi:hypothetical protein
MKKKNTKKTQKSIQKLRINPKNKAQKSITKSSRDLREKYKRKKKTTTNKQKIKTNKISRSRRLRKK